MNRWTLVRLDRSLGDHGAGWDALHASLFRPNPMLDSRFIDELLRHFGDGTECLAVFFSGGIARSMCVIRRRRIGVWSTFMPANTQIGAALISPSADIPKLISTLPGMCVQFDLLGDDPDFGDLSEIAPTPVRKQIHALTVSINLKGGFEAYWSDRSRSLVKNIARYERRCIADGRALRFTCIADPVALLPAIARYGVLESKGWKGKQGTAVAIDNPQGAFYADLIQRFAGAGKAYVYELWVGDHLAASRITICTNNTVVILKTTYDETLHEYAPGRLLLRDVIKHAFETHPDGVIEFYTDANADMLSWATEQRRIRHISYYHSAIFIRIIQTARACRKLLSQNFAPIF